jgi:hypothetical protein
MLRLVLALLTVAMLAPLTACGDDDPTVVTSGQPGTVVVDDDD